MEWLGKTWSNGRAHRTQVTFAAQPGILGRSGAARLLGQIALICKSARKHVHRIIRINSFPKQPSFAK
jgi:hypothetical protein